MTWFVDDPTAVTPVVTGSRSRAVGAGVDPFQYDEVTHGLTSLRDWLPAFAGAATAHREHAQAAEEQGKRASAMTCWRAAAVCWHVATTLPHPDTTALREASAGASKALSHYLRLRGDANRLAASDTGPQYVGELRRPDGARRPPVVLILPGLDSGRVEFLDLADALLTRGLAVAAIDGPGQGALLDQPPTPLYHHVVSAVLDELQQSVDIDADRVAVVGLSLGGLYAQLAAAHDPRITVAATVSGPSPMPAWDSLPPFATDTLQLRTGSRSAAQRFTGTLHEVDVAALISQPLLVVSGTADTFPTPQQARTLADSAPRAQLHLVQAGDHLCGNTRWRWLPQTSDWLADQLQDLR